MPKIFATLVQKRVTCARLVILGVLVLATAGCQMAPPVAESTAQSFLSIDQAANLEGIQRAGFDVDDTLLFSTGAFQKGFESGHEYDSEAFWHLVNGSDRENSVVKQAARTIVERYRERGIQVFAITARSPYGGVDLARYLNETLAIPVENVFFEPTAKTERIRQARLDVFFGDSDSDIEDAHAAGVRAIRVQRSEKSSYKNKDGTLRKYHPGQYGEQIIQDSKE